ncbi:MAG: type II toxin-antitoxin system HicB family antitoxin [Caulobacter sp.]|nr:type II toxin-antitoxin system HicB family antitoxin [Caulobacter sp.]
MSYYEQVVVAACLVGFCLAGMGLAFAWHLRPRPGDQDLIPRSLASVTIMGHRVHIDGRPGAWGVVFPDCPGCCAMGKTVEEALANSAEALADWLRATGKAGA